VKITKQELIEIIKEEVERSLDIEEQAKFDSTGLFAPEEEEEIPGVTTLQDEDPADDDAPSSIDDGGIFNQNLPANGVEHPKFGKIPYTDEEMTAFFAGVPLGGDVFSGEAWGGGIDALAKDDKFQSASKKGRLLILKVATRYIKGGNLKDMSIEAMPDEDLKKSEYRKLKRLYLKNHPNVKGMRRMRAARKNKKDFEAAHGSMSPEEYAATVSGGDFEAPVNTTVPSKDTMMTVTPPEVDAVDDIVRDERGVPIEKPPLPKNWKTLDKKDKIRRDYARWYRKYGPGSRGRRFKTKAERDRAVAKARDRAIARRNKKRKDTMMTATPPEVDAEKDSNPSNFRDRSKPFTAKKKPRGSKK
tara:strand:- start:63 stop:1139 length:1077 start_codon:yes stop_codon:yes gene_type:complete